MGLLVWDDDEEIRATKFRIVHKSFGKYQCDPDGEFVNSTELSTVVGPDGLAALLALLSPGPFKPGPHSGPRVTNFDEYVDVVLRLQTPYYEEARPHFGEDGVQRSMSDANETYPYLPGTLKRIAKGTSRSTPA